MSSDQSLNYVRHFLIALMLSALLWFFIFKLFGII